ncbi:MAG: hypothetical protein KKH28_09285 [Elusimicrobia bacterium]|nr:hypothetical protein [Elusimicrobiota bacterium]
MEKNETPPASRADQDENSFALVIEEHQRQVYCLALRLAGNAAAADDITQETFIDDENTAG